MLTRIRFYVTCAAYLIMLLGMVFVVIGAAWAYEVKDLLTWRPVPPPPTYVLPYEGHLTVNRVPLADIPIYCKNNTRAVACAYHDDKEGWCRIYLPHDLPAKLTAEVLAHEMGHCHGWKH